MLRLPRTAPSTRQRPDGGQPGQPPSSASQPPSPTAVLGALPLPKRPSKLAGADRGSSRLEGHAQDVVVLLNRGWFGCLRGAEPDDEVPPPPPPPTRGRQQQQQQQRQQPEGRPDTSPTTSGSQRSGSANGSQHSGTAAGVHLPRATLPQPILTQRQQEQAAAVQDLPGIGTWAGRYRLFGGREAGEAGGAAPGAAAGELQAQPPPDGDARGPRRSGSGDAPEPGEADDFFGSPVVLRAGSLGQVLLGGRRSGGASSISSDQAREDAWRWRFSRKWACEQKKYYDGEKPESMVSDDLDPMQFTQACGMGVNLQLLPPTSAPQQADALGQAAGAQDGRLLASASNLSALFDADASYLQPGLLGAEMSPGTSQHGAIAAGRLLQRTASDAATEDVQPAAGGAPPRRPSNGWLQGRSPSGPSATRSVLHMASKAQELLQKQRAIEQAEQDRWDRSRTAGDAWAGRSLEAVRIDMRGRFKYCVLRVSDGVGHTRFLVRGRAHAAPPALLLEVQAEAGAASRAAGVPAATVEVVGDGVMEWREDTERQLHLVPSTVPGEGLGRRAGSAESPTKAPKFLSDVSGLTASLVRQALPCHFRITTETASRSSSMSAMSNRF